MNKRSGMDLPQALEPYRKGIEATIKPYIKVMAKVEEKMAPWQSKFGGFPYLPKEMEYPKNTNGEFMFHLAQVNFTEVPKLDPFPNQGILQFYINGHDDLYGMDFNDMTRQSGFRVLFFPETGKDEDALWRDFGFLPRFINMPVAKPCSLSFERHYAPISQEDYRFEKTIFSDDIPESQEKRFEIYDAYQEVFRSDGHKIGGYPYFTQFDPRENEKYRSKEYKLLLQIDTDGGADIMWGDAGVGNFFIQDSNLRKKDFSQILYSWDCC